MSQRSNQEWIRDLFGAGGKASQLRAHEDLSRYLFVVAFNYLRNRKSEANPSALTGFHADEMAELAHDFAQDTLERLVRNDYALLDEYRGEGRFTSYMAVIVRRKAAQELRRAYWRRRVQLPQSDESSSKDSSSAIEFHMDAEDAGPEKMAARKQVAEVLKHCLDQLPDRQRFAFSESVVQERDTALVADVLGATCNAVYLLVSRARKQLAACLRAHGVDRYL